MAWPSAGGSTCVFSSWFSLTAGAAGFSAESWACFSSGAVPVQRGSAKAECTRSHGESSVFNSEPGVVLEQL